MKTYSIIDTARFAHRAPRPGIDVARAPGCVWLRAEFDDDETEADFLLRAKHEAAEAGFAFIEVSGLMNLDSTVHPGPIYTDIKE
jgi:hypothetical protein